MRALRVATLDEVLRYGSRGGHKALRARGLLPPIMGAAPLAIDASTPAYVFSSASVATLTTASFVPPPGSLLVVCYANAGASVNNLKPSNTGGAVTWDAAAKAPGTGQGGTSFWLGLVTTSASMTVTDTLTAGNVFWGFGVAVITGQAATPGGAIKTANAASGAITATTPALQGTNSLIVGSIDNFTDATTPVIPAGQSNVFGSQTFQWSSTTGGAAAAWAQYLAAMNLAAGATATISDTSPTTVQWQMSILEILAAPIPGAPIFPVFLPQTLGPGAVGPMFFARQPLPVIVPATPAPAVPTFVAPPAVVVNQAPNRASSY